MAVSSSSSASSQSFAKAGILTALLFLFYQNLQNAICSRPYSWSQQHCGVFDANSEHHYAAAAAGAGASSSNDNVHQVVQQQHTVKRSVQGLYQEEEPAESLIIHRVLIQEQERLQTEFQALLRANQYVKTSCFDRRLLLTPTRKKSLDGFTLEFQDLARQLQTAFATDRTLVVTSQWKSAYASCNSTSTSDTGDWTCLWKPPSNCTAVGQIRHANKRLATRERSSSKGIIDEDAAPFLISRKEIRKQRKQSVTKKRQQATTSAEPAAMKPAAAVMTAGGTYFHTDYYGTQRVLVGTVGIWNEGSSNVDRLPNGWETRMGRFWIRSQCLYFLWHPSPTLQQSIDQRIASSASMRHLVGHPQEDFIGIHIRLTDSRGSFAKDFGRNASITRTLDSYLAIAEYIRTQRQPSHINTIYLATDSQSIRDQVEALTSAANFNWTIVMQDNVDRSESGAFMWFESLRGNAAAGIATDVDVLKRASFLIGSYQSNVFRLVAGLQQAYHVSNFTFSRGMERVYPVDVEWYEDP
jgi:hypothetical protein